MQANTNGKQGSIYRPKRSSYSIQNRIDFWEVAESDKPKISASEYAKKYNFSADYVRELCRAGILKGLKSRGKWLIIDAPIGG